MADEWYRPSSSAGKGRNLMLAPMLKWVTIALVLLALFSALTALYMYYTLNFGACSTGGEGCEINIATLYAAGIGIVGFSTSALAAFITAKRFRDTED